MEAGNSAATPPKEVAQILGFGDEILLHIVKYLRGNDFNHGDLVNLSATCSKFKNLLEDRSLSGILKFDWNLFVSRQALVGYLKQRGRFEVVTKLQIVDLYWVPSGVIRDVIVQMSNLKELLTAGTRLSWVHLKEILTTVNNVESLSWSWDSGLEESVRKKGTVNNVRFMELIDLKHKFLKLKNLLLHVPISANLAPNDLIVCSFTSFVYLISLCRNLEQLWVLSWPKTSQERKFSSNFFYEVFESEEFDLPNLRVLVIDVKEPPRIHIPRTIAKLLKCFERNKIKPRILWLDDPLINRQTLTVRRGVSFQERVWPTLDLSETERFSFPLMNETLSINVSGPFPLLKAAQLSHGMPRVVNLKGVFAGAQDMESLSCKAFNFKNDWRTFVMNHPKLKEVNFAKNEGVEYPDYCAALADLPLLEKVSVPLDVLVDIKDSRIKSEFSDCAGKEEDSRESNAHSLGFKKKRVGVSTKQNNSGLSGLQLLTHRCPLVNEVEIGYSSKSCHAGRLLVDSLFYLAQWKFLKKLSLDSIPIKHGKFLHEIVKCTSLESIRLSHLGPSGRCAYISDLTIAVRSCPNLKDIRIEQNYLGSITQLLVSLKTCTLLQRILLWSSPNDSPLDGDAVHDLFANCKQLTVFYAVIEPTLKSVCKKLRKSLTDQYKNARPSLSIFIETSLEDDRILAYPSIHFRQLVVNASQVCQYNQFPTFH